MAKYRVLQDSFIGNCLVKAGDFVDYDGEVSANLQKVSAKQAAAAGDGSGADSGASPDTGAGLV